MSAIQPRLILSLCVPVARKYHLQEHIEDSIEIFSIDDNNKHFNLLWGGGKSVSLRLAQLFFWQIGQSKASFIFRKG
jgi:hypothetical protein